MRFSLAIAALAMVMSALLSLQSMIILCVFICALLFMLMSASRYASLSTSLIKYIFLFIVFFAIGCFNNYWHSQKQWPHPLDNQVFTLSGVVASLPEVKEGELPSVRFKIIPLTLLNQDDEDVLNASSHHSFGDQLWRLSWYYPQFDIVPGALIHAEIKLKRPRGLANQAGFNYHHWLLTQGITATGYIRSHPQAYLVAQHELSDCWRIGLSVCIAMVRYRLYQNLHQSIGNLPSAKIFYALTLGIKQHLTQDDWQVLNQTGTTHLLVISGLHVGLVAALFYWIGYRIRRYIPIKKQMLSPITLGCLLSIIASGLYAMLAGFTLPTQRAFIMVLFLLLGRLLGLNWPIALAFLSALVAVLLLQPFSPLSAGFWLSFFAVFILLLAFSYIRKPTRYEKWVRPHLFVSLGLIPLLLYWLGNASVVSPFINFIVVPVFTIIVVPAALVGLVFAQWLPSIANSLFSMLTLLVELPWLLHQKLLVDASSDTLFNTIINAINSLASLLPSSLSLQQLLLSFVLVVLCCLPKHFPAKILALPLLLVWFFPTKKTIEQGGFIVDMLDVGQGLSVTVRTQKTTTVYDTGNAFSSGFVLAESVILPFLKQVDRDQIDRLVISHNDDDHAAGAEALLTSLPVNNLFIGQSIDGIDNASDNDAVKICQQQTWTVDGVAFEFMNVDVYDDYDGDEKKDEKDNNYSCVLKISNAFYSVLLTGDIEKSKEAELVDYWQDALDVDVLLVPHHGSKTSSSLSFLEATSPSMALVSAGYNNRFNHPAKKIMKRYDEQNIRVFNTAIDGQVTLVIPSQQTAIQVIRHRQHGYRPWYLQVPSLHFLPSWSRS